MKKILFMGTPGFAAASLAALYESGEYSITVVTQPDKPKGRGYAVTPSEVKVYALEHGLTVYQPATLRDEAFASLLAEIDPDMIVVAAYGKLLPKNVIDYPEYGCINVHGSLLPEYRGAAPVQRAIIDGRTVTGITIMYMAEGLDTGDMLEKAEVPIGENIGFIAMIPNFETKTSDMRRALPECVPMGDAIFNLSRVAVLIRAMETGDLNLIAHAMTDRLHQPYREKLIDDCDRARRAAMESGAAAFCISGSGSTCLAVADGENAEQLALQTEENAETIAEGIRKKLADSPYGWRVLHLNPDRCGAQVEELR